MSDRIQKSSSYTMRRADAAKDIELINQYAVKQLSPEDVFCFSVVLCHNDVDRDNERFTDPALSALAKMFVGKTGISDHRWSAERQIARIYRAAVETTEGTTKLGTPLKHLVASAYMLRNDSNKSIIEAIEGGIMKEVSVGCSMRQRTCSICGKSIHYDWRVGKELCEDGHEVGKTYDGKFCCCELDEPKDAYEFSFVAVPAQPGAGVTKGMHDIEGAFKMLLEADLSQVPVEEVNKLIHHLKFATISADEKAERAKIAAKARKALGINNP